MNKCKYYVVVAVLSIFLCSCGTTKSSQQNEYKSVSIPQLLKDADRYNGDYVKVRGYILGSEYQKTKKDVSSYIVVISHRPQNGDRNSVFQPHVLDKIRGAEFGYNDRILKKCNDYSQDSIDRNREVALYGQFFKKTSFRQYGEGIQIRLQKVAFANKTINCNYGDTTTFRKKAPGAIKMLYKGFKKVGNFFGKAF